MSKAESRLAAVVVAATLLVSACSLVSNTSAPDDNAIKTAIQAKLYQDPALKTRDIHVDSQKGVVVLSGSVGSDQEKSTAEGLANQTSGVKQVIDELTIATATIQETPPPPTSASPLQAPQVNDATARPTRVRHARRVRAEARPAPQPAAEAATAEPVEAAAAPSAPAAQPAPATQPAPAPAAPPPPPPPVQATIPSGTVVTVRMIDAVDSARNRPGDEFDATVNSAVVAGDRVAIPQGSNAKVRLVEAKTSGRMTGSSQLQLELASLTVNGTTYEVQSGYYTQQGASRGKRTAETVGGGAVLGALIGAIAGKGKGAAIGAGVGAATGAGVEAAGKGQQVKIPSEAKLDFTLKAPLTVTLSH
ncbi:MAG TPA: BON domain-containing protein [Terriglobia bacterium]|nr:BON domain-containing protein [Terriglobia bacterium]